MASQLSQQVPSQRRHVRWLLALLLLFTLLSSISQFSQAAALGAGADSSLSCAETNDSPEMHALPTRCAQPVLPQRLALSRAIFLVPHYREPTASCLLRPPNP